MRLAHWSEFDFKNATWIMPASRMKMRRKHVVPLASQVLDLLNELHAYTGNGELPFPSSRAPSYRTYLRKEYGCSTDKIPVEQYEEQKTMLEKCKQDPLS